MTVSLALPPGMSLTLPFAASSVGVARAQFLSWLGATTGARLDPEFVEDGRLVVSELVGNAVRHAAPLPGDCVHVAWKVAATEIEISVTDGGASTRPETVDAGLSALGGRGLSIVTQLCSRWWMDSNVSRSTIYATMSPLVAA